MEQSILKSTKKLVNVADDDTSFDLDLLTHINTAFSHLRQLGIGPTAGFFIEDDAPTWADFLPEPDADTPEAETYKPIINAVKNNVALRVRMDFDPPSQWHVLNAMTNQISASDWHLSVLREETAWINPDPEPSKEAYLEELIETVDSQVIR
jgi:hypothetical protein